MYLNPTPPLSKDGSEELLKELQEPVKDTPELKKQRERVAAVSQAVKQNKKKLKKESVTA